jgi:hypothetical protein
MVTSAEETVSFSFSMLWVPIAVTLLYLLPSRNVYLLAIIFIMTGYLLASYVGAFWSILTAPGRLLIRAGRRRWTPVVDRSRKCLRNVVRRGQKQAGTEMLAPVE